MPPSKLSTLQEQVLIALSGLRDLVDVRASIETGVDLIQPPACTASVIVGGIRQSMKVTRTPPSRRSRDRSHASRAVFDLGTQLRTFVEVGHVLGVRHRLLALRDAPVVRFVPHGRRDRVDRRGRA